MQRAMNLGQRTLSLVVRNTNKDGVEDVSHRRWDAFCLQSADLIIRYMVKSSDKLMYYNLEFKM